MHQIFECGLLAKTLYYYSIISFTVRYSNIKLQNILASHKNERH